MVLSLTLVTCRADGKLHPPQQSRQASCKTWGQTGSMRSQLQFRVGLKGAAQEEPGLLGLG